MGTKLPTVFIDGEAGTTGLQIRQRLAGLPLSLISLDHARRKDPTARRDAMAESDITILCLPDEAAREAVQMATRLQSNAPKLIDASSAHRTDPAWAYGFPELSREQPSAIATASKVSNPGCYATGAIALLRPLKHANIIPAHHPITISAISGYTGGGRNMIEHHEKHAGPAFEYYALDLTHKHLPEIQKHSGLECAPIFIPSVGHFPQGMMVTIGLHAKSLPHAKTAAELCKILPSPPTRPLADALANTDDLEIAVYESEKTGDLLLWARLDNLGKGASGAAVQNLKLMLGW